MSASTFDEWLANNSIENLDGAESTMNMLRSAFNAGQSSAVIELEFNEEMIAAGAQCLYDMGLEFDSNSASEVDSQARNIAICVFETMIDLV